MIAALRRRDSRYRAVFSTQKSNHNKSAVSDLAQIAELLTNITLIKSSAAVEDILEKLLGASGPISVCFVNAHGVNLCRNDEDVMSAFLDSDIKVRDGIGLKIWYFITRQDAGLNMCGTDFIPLLLERTLGRRIAIWGTVLPTLSVAENKLKCAGHLVVSSLHGFHDHNLYCDAFAAARPDVVILGMGMPRQERLAVRLKAVSDRPCIIVSGGAILDFMGGRFPRAPVAMRKMGLEWVYRLMIEPRRLFRRYVIGNFTFLFNCIVLSKKMKNKAAMAIRVKQHRPIAPR